MPKSCSRTIRARRAEWLTEADQEFLVAALGNVPTGDGWIAGCLWQGRDPSDIDKVVRRPSGTATAWRSTTPGERLVSLISVAGVEPARDFDSIEGPGFFCYVPEPTGGDKVAVNGPNK